MPKDLRRAILVAVIAWDLVWRVRAVRLALRRHELKWAAALAVVNSAGILPILYIRRRGR